MSLVHKMVCRTFSAYHELLHREGEGGGVEQYLAVIWQVADDVVQHALEVLGQQFVSLEICQIVTLKH